MEILRSLRKSWRLRKLSKVLGGKQAADFEKACEDWVTQFRAGQGSAYASREAALEEFLNLCEADPNIRALVNKYAIDRSRLKGIYIALLVSGAGRWARGHWVAASALAFPSPLAYILKAQAAGGFSTRQEKTHVAVRLVQYFELGETGPVE